MLQDIYHICHKAAEIIMGTMIVWPINQMAFEFSWWLSGVLTGQL